MIGQQKNQNPISLKLPLNRKTCNHFLKSRCTLELSWNFLRNTDAPIFFFLQSCRCDSNEQHVFKKLEYMMIFDFIQFVPHFLFHIQGFHFINLCFSISPSPFLLFFIKPLLSAVEKFLYTYIHMYNKYIIYIF